METYKRWWLIILQDFEWPNKKFSQVLSLSLIVIVTVEKIKFITSKKYFNSSSRAVATARLV